MRLTAFEADTIRDVVQRLLGASARVYLFGSRVNDDARGGDIDLYVECDTAVLNRAVATARLVSTLQRSLGDQHIDVVLVDPSTPEQPVHHAARRGGVAL